jgi:RIO kinase 1
MLDAIDEFVAEGLVIEVVSVIKSGKEATAYLCRIEESLGAELGVAKVYHPRDRRNFANDSVYEVGKRLLEAQAGREARAVAGKSQAGRAIQSAMWVDHEFEVMSALNYAGLDVPEPYAATERAILMEFVGDKAAPSPQLHHVRLDACEGRRLLERTLWNVEGMLRENHIHADLSPYNVLYDGGRLAIIDIPQAVDPRFHPRGEALLARDVRNMAAYFARQGVTFDHDAWCRDLWSRFVMGQL